MVNKNKISTFLLILIAIVFIVLGFLRSDNLEVLNKAIRVCLECIGIG
jgi:hypothetical protein